MAEGKNRQLWQLNSFILAMIHNVNADKAHRMTPDEFNPYAPKKPKPLLKGKGLSCLKNIFCREQTLREKQEKR